jgi:hypothetical protein
VLKCVLPRRVDRQTTQKERAEGGKRGGKRERGGIERGVELSGL